MEKLFKVFILFILITSGYSACLPIASIDYKYDSSNKKLYLRENLDSKDINTTNIFGIDSGKYEGLYNDFYIDSSSIYVSRSTGIIDGTDELDHDIHTAYYANGPRIDQNATYAINYKVKNFSKTLTFDYTKYSKTNYPIAFTYNYADLTHVENQILTLNYTKFNKNLTVEYERVDPVQKSVTIPANQFTFVDDTQYDKNITVPITYKEHTLNKNINFTYKQKEVTIPQSSFNNTLIYKTHQKTNYSVNLTYPDVNSSTILDIYLPTLLGDSDAHNFTLISQPSESSLSLSSSGNLTGDYNSSITNASLSFTYENKEIVEVNQVKALLFANDSSIDLNEVHNISMTNLQNGLSVNSNGIISGTVDSYALSSVVTGDTNVTFSENTIEDINLKDLTEIDANTSWSFSISNGPSGTLVVSEDGNLSGTIDNHLSSDNLSIKYKTNQINNIDLSAQFENDSREINITGLRELSFNSTSQYISGDLELYQGSRLTSVDLHIKHRNNEINTIDLNTLIDTTHIDARDFSDMSLPMGLNINLSSGEVSGVVDSRIDINGSNKFGYYRNTIKDVNLTSELEEQYSSSLNSRLFSTTSLPDGLKIEDDNRTISGVMEIFDDNVQSSFDYYTNSVNKSEYLYKVIGLSVAGESNIDSLEFKPPKTGDGFYQIMSTLSRGVQNTVFPSGIGFTHVFNSVALNNPSEEYLSQYTPYLNIGGSIAPDNELDLSIDITFSLDYYLSNEIDTIDLVDHISDSKARNFVVSSFTGLPSGIDKNLNGEIYGNMHLRQASANIGFEYYNSTIIPIDLNSITYLDDSVARYFSKKTNGLPNGLSINHTTGVISGEVISTVSDATSLSHFVNIDYENNEIIDIQIAQDNISKVGITDYDYTLFTNFSVTNLPNGLNFDSSRGIISGYTTDGEHNASKIITTLSYDPKELTFDVVVKDKPKLNISNIHADKSYFDLTKSSFNLNRYFTDDSDDNMTYNIEKSEKSFGLPRGYTQEQCDGNITGSLNDNIDNNAMKVKARDILGQESPEHTFILRYLVD